MMRKVFSNDAENCYLYTHQKCHNFSSDEFYESDIQKKNNDFITNDQLHGTIPPVLVIE